jgi:hypothetical protein
MKVAMIAVMVTYVRGRNFIADFLLLTFRSFLIRLPRDFLLNTHILTAIFWLSCGRLFVCS